MSVTDAISHHNHLVMGDHAEVKFVESLRHIRSQSAKDPPAVFSSHFPAAYIYTDTKLHALKSVVGKNCRCDVKDSMNFGVLKSNVGLTIANESVFSNSEDRSNAHRTNNMIGRKSHRANSQA